MVARIPNLQACNSSTKPTGVRAMLLIVFAVVAIPRDAHAYLDAGTGSMLIQALIAGVAAGLIVIKVYWAKIRSLFGNRSLEPSADAEGHDHS